MPETIFTEDQSGVPPVVPPATITTIPSIPPELVELVGAGKKYSTVEQALAAVPHAQKHINTLETELAVLRADLTKRQTTQELLEQLQSIQGQPGTPPVQTGMDQNSVLALVEQTLEKNKAKTIASQNANLVADNFRKLYGDKAEEQYNKIAQESGLTVQALNILAAEAPTAVLRLAGINTQNTPSTVAKLKSDVNTQSIQNNSTDIPNAKVAKGGSSREVLDAWKRAGEAVKKENNWD